MSRSATGRGQKVVKNGLDCFDWRTKKVVDCPLTLLHQREPLSCLI